MPEQVPLGQLPIAFQIFLGKTRSTGIAHTGWPLAGSALSVAELVNPSTLMACIF